MLGLDWRKSEPHLWFLEKFLQPCKAVEYEDREYLKTALGESPAMVVNRFVEEGVLIQAPPAALLNLKTLKDIKPMLRLRGLRLTGCKQDLIDRLVESDPKGVSAEINQAMPGFFLCSESGRKLAEENLAEKKKLEEQIFEYLKQRQFREAALAGEEYAAKQPFAWGNPYYAPTPERDAEILKIIFSERPQILSKFSDEQVDALRLPAGANHLLGRGGNSLLALPFYQTGVLIRGRNMEMTGPVAMRMLQYYAMNKAQINEYRRMGVTHVEISATESSCMACKRLQDKVYKIDDVPELPYQRCTDEGGCRCVAAGSSEDDSRSSARPRKPRRPIDAKSPSPLGGDTKPSQAKQTGVVPAKAGCAVLLVAATLILFAIGGFLGAMLG